MNRRNFLRSFAAFPYREIEPMKERTDEEILAKLAEVFVCDRLDQPTFKIHRHGENLRLTIAKMYDAPGFSFSTLEALAEFFDTKNIETESEFSSGGCETCDYGSEYGYDLVVRPGDPFRST